MVLSPNPVRNRLQVQIDLANSASQATLSIVDFSGRRVQQRALEGLQKEWLDFDTAVLPAGVYFLHLKTPEGILSKRFVKVQ